MHKHIFVWRCTMNYFNLQKKPGLSANGKRYIFISALVCEFYQQLGSKARLQPPPAPPIPVPSFVRKYRIHR